MNATFDPFTGPAPAEVPLAHAPLVRVLAQLRFPVIASIERREFIAPFQEALRKTYPILRPEPTKIMQFGPEGMQMQSGMTWRFENSQKTWRVILAPDFVALETTLYSSREDFLARLHTVLDALHRHIDPVVVDRLGMRYIDRIEGVHLRSLREMIRPEILGILGTDFSAHVAQSITQNVFSLVDSNVQVLARWGWIPANATIDPATVDALDHPSWILDLDTFLEGPIDFEQDVVLGHLRGFAERIYSVFRWAVTDEFLRVYGGTP